MPVLHHQLFENPQLLVTPIVSMAYRWILAIGLKFLGRL
jgi:hypothetical protein